MGPNFYPKTSTLPFSSCFTKGLRGSVGSRKSRSISQTNYFESKRIESKCSYTYDFRYSKKTFENVQTGRSERLLMCLYKLGFMLF